jgi:type IV pilus assembly protein PilC
MPKRKNSKTAKKKVTTKKAPAKRASVKKEKKIKEVEVAEKVEEKDVEQEALEVVEESQEEEVIEPEEKKKRFSFSFGKKKEKIAPVAAPKKKSELGKFFSSLNNMGMGKQRVAMIQSMSMMMNAGLPLIDTLSTLEMEMKHKATKKILRNIAASVNSGTPLWRSMDEAYLFTPYEVALVRIGEEAGSLAQNLEYLAIQQEKDHALSSKVRMAMIYPTIVMVLMFIIVMGLGLFVLPNLIQVLMSLNADLPVTTRAVIYITNMFSDYGMIFVPGSAAGFFVLMLLSKFTRFRVVSQWFMFKIPGIGSLGRHATIARFGVILGGLLRAGVPLTDSLSSLENVTHIVAYKKFYGEMLDHITMGDSFSISFAAIKGSDKLLPISVQQLVITGERSGTLSETLLKIADIYEKKAAETAERLPIILEPMILLFIGGLVGTIAFAIITPIYGVVGNIGR